MSVREAKENEEIVKSEFVYRLVGPGGMEHNYLCSVCRESSAVIETWHGILQPCWTCQSKGWRLFKTNWLMRFLNSRLR